MTQETPGEKLSRERQEAHDRNNVNWDKVSDRWLMTRDRAQMADNGARSFRFKSKAQRNRYTTKVYTKLNIVQPDNTLWARFKWFLW